MNEKNDNGLTKKISCEKKNDTQQEQTVMTNMGEIPIEDYREIVAQQNGFDSYEDMYNHGIRIRGISDNSDNSDTHKSYDSSDLAVAIHTNDINMIKKIIKSNDELLNEYYKGDTPLHTAVKAGSVDCVNELLNCGSYPDTLDANRNTPLYYAVKNNNVDVAKPLLKASANPDLKNSDGKKLIDCSKSHEMKQLLEYYSYDYNRILSQCNSFHL